MSKALFRSIYGLPFPTNELRFRSIKKSIREIGYPGRMKGNDDDARKFNLDLLSIEGKLYDTYNAIRNEGIPTATILKNRYTGADEKQRMLVPIFQNHNREMAELVPKEEDVLAGKIGNKELIEAVAVVISEIAN